MKIEDEIKQPSFPNEFHKAHINILYTSSWLGLQVTHWLKPFNISMQQFNLLRILRGKSPGPSNVKELTERMLDKSSNASRLVDKLVNKNQVSKCVKAEDQRRVDVFITDGGFKVLKEASAAVEQGLIEVFETLTKEEAVQLNYLLDKLRGR